MREAEGWAAPAKKKKKARLSSAQLRERLLTTAVSMLTKSGGLTVSLAHLNMEDLIRIADVPRSSVYRVWESKDSFYVDLMERMIEPVEGQGAAFDEETLEIAMAVVNAYRDRLCSADGRRAVLREAIRQGVAQNFKAVARSLSWSTSSALIATLPTLQQRDRQRVLGALKRTEAHFVERMADFYGAMMGQLGLRLKVGITAEMLAATASSVVEGLIGRSVTNPGIVATPIIRPGIDGQPVEWHLAAVGFLGIVDEMVEPDPAWSP
ncbi:TetR/AcrR family transcriptional regulator [Mycobacteroides abscessus]|uniref:TetR/AcrR family transcriptional regulator n=1 Tax=Mycobacteroides abscessus TaxID=36809 RepID=UPI0021077A73|nr:TetR/AcrR family transcriptional regulator [Mycobacteroides abscessus]